MDSFGALGVSPGDEWRPAPRRVVVGISVAAPVPLVHVLRHLPGQLPHRRRRRADAANMAVAEIRLRCSQPASPAAPACSPGGDEPTSARGKRSASGEGRDHRLSATWRNYLAAPAHNRLYGWSADRFGAAERRCSRDWLPCPLPSSPCGRHGPRCGAYAHRTGFAVDLTLGFHGLMYRFCTSTCFRSTRCGFPALAVILVGFSLAVLAGFGVERLSGRLRAPGAGSVWRWSRCRRARRGLVHTGALYDDSVGPPPIYADLLSDIGTRRQPNDRRSPDVIAEDQIYMSYSTSMADAAQWLQRLLSASYVWSVAVMRRFPDARSLDALRARGASYALIHGERLAPETYRRLIDEIDGCQCGLVLVARRPWQSQEISLYRIELGKV